jgi:hypothetical protein
MSAEDRIIERAKAKAAARTAAETKAKAIIGELRAEFDRQNEADGLTYYEVAKRAGQEQIGVQRVLDGLELPNLARAIGIAAALGKTLVIADKKQKAGKSQ